MSFEVLEISFEALKTNFEVGFGRKMIGEGDPRLDCASQPDLGMGLARPRFFFFIFFFLSHFDLV
jgi:hypothetical protein